MKRSFLIILSVITFLFTTNTVFSQDNRSLRNRKVLPILKSDETIGLTVELVPLGSRYYFGGQQISKQEFASIVAVHPSANKKYITGTNLRLFGNIIAIPSLVVAGTIYLIDGYDYEGQYDYTKEFGLSAGLVLVGVLMTVGGGTLLKTAAIEYNDAVRFGLKLGLQKHGVGVAFIF